MPPSAALSEVLSAGFQVAHMKNKDIKIFCKYHIVQKIFLNQKCHNIVSGQNFSNITIINCFT